MMHASDDDWNVAEAFALEIERVMTDPERVRPLAPDAKTATDFANDWQWCVMILRGQVV